MLKVTREQVVAFRASGLGLHRRQAPDRLVDVLRPCGFQDTPPGNAALAAAARLDGLTPECWREAVEREKSLVELWAMRGSPFVVATEDLPVFTTALLPDDESVMIHLMTTGMRPVVEASGVRATDLVDSLVQRTRGVLDGQLLSKRELGVALGPGVPEPLRSRFHGDADLSTLTLTAARAVAHHGVYLIAPRTGSELTFVRTDQWLGAEPPRLDPREARAELVRRFLTAFGPATAADLAWWANERTDGAAKAAHEAHARRMWSLVEGELEEVECHDRTRGHVLASDLGRLLSPPGPGGVRLVPPYDPLLAVQDRRTLIPDRTLHKRVWRAMHNPGVVLDGTDVPATWRTKKSGRRLDVIVEPLARPLARAVREAVEAQAAGLAPLLGCERTEVEFAD